ncbi:uncharacterized protein DC041_0010708 [Schistosoma bovis]|uniref:ERAP1-like C-terminal domain-containing protein n=1 Tax=Schistosoma bovis TaxID=6184 RepID=A0A430PZK7_SCHBO|nr:uncharacterized protein DC041_0010708 [Schistosoma bovis]
MLAMDESYGAFQAYLRTLVDDPLKSVNWTTMKEDKDHMKQIPPSLRPAVYCTAIRIGGQKEWEFLKQRLLEVDIKEDEKNSILQALSCSRDMWIVLAMQNSGQKLLENHVLKRGLNDLFKRSKENMKWTKTHRDVISNWLNKNVPNTITLL